ncbi:MAG: rRNA pseudouridine synthase [Clostridiales bacterium]|nr:rRNA pseudouridine synthase [Clostridiales bacterium]
MKLLRLDKYLSDMGIGTRSELKTWIRKGRVKVNGEIIIKPEHKVKVNKDEIYFDDGLISYQQYRYIMLHKPAGVVSATTDKVNKTVIDLIKDKNGRDLFPVGRLDKDTEGFLLITDDGPLAHRLLSPKNLVDKIYYAKVKGKVDVTDVKAFAEGVSIEADYITMPAKLSILHAGDISEVEVTIHEGKFHQVKRMFAALGKEVIYLKRLSMGGLSLDPLLHPGEYRELTEEEVELLKEL